MAAEFPLVCPFCDELAYRKRGYRQIVLPHKIYTPRVCIMGHEFYSVEEIPYEQSEIVKEMREIKKDAQQWRKQLKNIDE